MPHFTLPPESDATPTGHPTSRPDETVPAIELRGVSKQYGGQAVVSGVSLAVAAGETLVLLGTSGSGKTTTLKMINRLVDPTAGQVLVDGQDVRHAPVAALRRQMGYVIQEAGLFPHYTVAQNVAVVPRLLGWDAARTHARTLELLRLLRLPDLTLAQYPAQLSGGQRQRVGLARALAADPPVVLMDEPFGALDPITRADIRREFRDLPALRQKTVVLVTHDVAEAFELGDRVAVMHAGQIQQLDTPRNLLRRPANDFVARFLADQRLALQLKTFTLADLAPYLPNHPTSDDPAREVTADLSLADALTALQDAPALTFTARGLRCQTGADTLMTALGAFTATSASS